MKWSVYKEQTILLVYAANNRDSRSKRQKLVKLKEKEDKFKNILRNFITTLSRELKKY